jgi:hypothetical protein
MALLTMETERLPAWPSQTQSHVEPSLTFNHTPLKLGQPQFRLLCVEFIATEPVEVIYERGDPGQCPQICCILETFDFDEWPLPAYKAISYAWGPKLPLSTISINGRPFSVRENLWHFLEQYALRMLKLDTIDIWIDQIFIDQKSMLEKTHQVGLMSRIYKHAVQVVS